MAILAQMPLSSSTVASHPKFSRVHVRLHTGTTTFIQKKKGSLDFSVIHISYIHTLADTIDAIDTIAQQPLSPFPSLASGPTSHD